MCNFKCILQNDETDCGPACLAASGSSSNYVNKEAGYGTTVGSTKHIFTLSNNSNALIYNVVGTQS